MLGLVLGGLLSLNGRHAVADCIDLTASPRLPTKFVLKLIKKGFTPRWCGFFFVVVAVSFSRGNEKLVNFC